MSIQNSPFLIKNRKSVPGAKMLASEDYNKGLKNAVWLYFWLLIFEGALRKWVFPGLSTPLLIVRDPIAFWIVITAWRTGHLSFNSYVTTAILIGFVGLFTALFFGHRNLMVALFGARVLILHFPLMFIIGRVFTRKDVLKMGKTVLILSVPMVVLIGLQFYSPQSAWVNRGVGGDIEGGGFSGALGYFRPPATFSFISGTVLFFSLAVCYLFYFWLNQEEIKYRVLVPSTFALIAAIPFSISRSLFVNVLISLTFSLLVLTRKPKYIVPLISGVVSILIVFLIFAKMSFFQTSTEAFTSRLVDATESEGGVEGVFVDRFLAGMVEALASSSQLPFFGYGIGMGTNVGSMLLAGTTTFLISEGEWGRTIGELGPLMGIAVILIRLLICLQVSLASYRNLKAGNILPWLLLAFAILNISQSQWAQPTSLGFSTLIGGLILASLKRDKTIILKNRS